MEFTPGVCNNPRNPPVKKENKQINKQKTIHFIVEAIFSFSMATKWHCSEEKSIWVKTPPLLNVQILVSKYINFILTYCILVF